jgi:succinate dehydrogenase / fumarate reductase, cytochrome b subunit
MKKKRPVNLNLFTIRFPATAIVSILHRASGVVLFGFIVFLLYALQLTLQSPEQFSWVHTFFAHLWVRFFVWVFLSAFILHLLAGLRHLVMDFGFAEEKASGRYGAYLVMILAVAVMLVLGVYLW